jgi:hypothetical protein
MKKYIWISLLLLAALLLAACGGQGNLPDLPDASYCTVTFYYGLPTNSDPAQVFTEKVLKGTPVQGQSLAGDNQYELEGWYLNGERWDFDTPVTEDIRLEPNWIRREYIVGYRLGEHIRIEGVVYYGDTAGDPYRDTPDRFTALEEWKDMTEQGYVFLGWMYEGELWDFENNIVTENIVLDAYFVPADEVSSL